MQKVMSVKNLNKDFKRVIKHNFWKDLFKPEIQQVKAVKDVSFAINKGESVAFLGPNGAGKTTTIKMLTGLIYPSSGEVEILGFTPFDRKKEYLKRIGLVMGNKAGLNWDLTPAQSFELLKYIYEIPEEEYKKRIKFFTELLETEKFLNTQVRRLSLGERMKMELIGAILHQPDILFLDEPTIGLDIISKQKIRQFLRQIQRETGVTLLLTSHDMDDIEEVCDRVVVINHGQKIYDNPLQTLTSKYSNFKYIKVIFKEMPKDLSSFDYEVVEKNKISIMYKVPRSELSSFISKVTTSFELEDIDISSVPLEEIIADLFRKG